MSCIGMIVWAWALASLRCRDGARRVLTDQVQALLASSAKHRQVLDEWHEG